MTEEYHFTPEEQKLIDDAVEEASSSWVRQNTVAETEKEFRKDVVDVLINDKGAPISKTLFNDLVKERYENRSSEMAERHENVVALNEMLRNNNND